MADAQAFINPKSGSIRITGVVELVDADGKVLETIENPKFCGCGQSREKPLCDGSHKGILKE
jgi:CDGSH-type Zn-finger protein